MSRHTVQDREAREGTALIKITIEISDVTYSLLEVLTRGDSPYPSVEDVIEELCDHAQQGVLPSWCLGA